MKFCSVPLVSPLLKAGYLTWNASETAETYIVTAQTNGGHKVQFSTNETSTFIAELTCGQEYFLSVQAVDSVCRSVPSMPEVLKSGTLPVKPQHSNFLNKDKPYGCICAAIEFGI